MGWQKISALICNIIVCLSFGFGVLLFYKIGKPTVQGFYCNDDSINKPFKNSTLPSKEVTIVAMVLCLFCFIVVESYNVFLNKLSGSSLGQYARQNAKSLSYTVIALFCIYLFGAGVTMFITDVGKYTVGRLRPHFYAVCKPDWKKLNCTDSSGVNNYFVGDHFCRASQEKMKEARLSFPSGHSSFSAFSAFHLVFYIQSQLAVTNKFGFVPKVCVQVLLVCLAFYCGCSRIADNKHHPTDVAAGLFLGVAVAYCFHVVLSQKRQERILSQRSVNDSANVSVMIDRMNQE
ncbi:phospholipid phosphatase 1-like [Hydractinia symbiolongicarpus]|uniref:phospholipid phosphatase 1-like n=1 Tax=Hydractinia symbiolongicarpus TaxID=13093 RepID=UPI00254E0DA1|nr:phospholipid phosphatase 1-like [Hydractinia symbiolongicarpus]